MWRLGPGVVVRMTLARCTTRATASFNETRTARTSISLADHSGSNEGGGRSLRDPRQLHTEGLGGSREKYGQMSVGIQVQPLLRSSGGCPRECPGRVRVRPAKSWSVSFERRLAVAVDRQVNRWGMAGALRVDRLRRRRPAMPQRTLRAEAGLPSVLSPEDKAGRGPAFRRRRAQAGPRILRLWSPPGSSGRLAHHRRSGAASPSCRAQYFPARRR